MRSQQPIPLELDPRGLSIATHGFMSAKVDLTSADPMGDQYSLNHHGALYMDILPSLRIADGADLHLRLNLQNTSFSELRSEKADWFVKAAVERPFWQTSAEDSSKLWRLEAGNFDPVTLGHGLTFKDFQALGFSGRLDWNGVSMHLATWAQDYGEGGDIFTARVHLARYHAGVNAVLWIEKVSIDYRSLYVLPYFSVPLRNWEAYGEAGIRIPEKESRSWNNVRGYPDWTPAALIGLHYGSPWTGWRLRVNSEVRYYGKNFIPLAETVDAQFTSLYNYDKTSNNWIDHFSSVLASQWIYLKTALETPALRGVSLFAENELLLFLGDQKLVWDQQYHALISHDPSSDFYWTGIRYRHRNRLRLEVLATNRLINLDPKVNLRPFEDPLSLGNWQEVRRQYRSRFYAAEMPLLELRLVWGMDAD